MRAEEKLYFRDQLRAARTTALQDAEAFDEIIHVLERMGSFLRGVTDKLGNLNVFKPFITPEAERSSLAKEIPKDWPELHPSFSALYELVRESRNKAMHEGSFARHLTEHAIELSIILEHAMVMELNEVDPFQVSHFMVRNPVCAAKWQPLSFIRQAMLTNSFSYLPVLISKEDPLGWRLVSDLTLAQYLQAATSKANLRERLTMPLEKFLESENMILGKPQICKPDKMIAELIKNWDGLPMLVQSERSSELLGILTPFDLL